MRVLITGANGLLGQKLVGLLNNTTEVIATSKGPCRFLLPHKGLTYQSMDITDASQVAEVVAKYQPEVIVHTAAMTNVDQCEADKAGCWQVNVDGTDHIAQAAKGSNIFLLHLSTDFIFDGVSGPYDEMVEPSPVNYYGESKWASEKLVQALSSPWAIARTVLVYGWVPEMSRSNIILWVKESLEQGKTIQVVDDQVRTPTLVEDLATGCALILAHQANGVFNIAGPELLTPYEMAMQAAGFFELDQTLIRRADARSFTQPAQRPLKTGFLIDKARLALGYQPHSFKEGMTIMTSQMIAGKKVE